jgi:alpha-ribazole phosphatase
LTTLLLVRHGQTLWNNELRYQGQMDTDLSELGRVQAARVAECLRDEPLAAIYTSDLRRSAHTADIVAGALGMSANAVPGLREASYGVWEGLTYAEVRARYPELVAERRRDPFGFTPPGGESLGATYDRVLAALRTLADRHPRESVLIVTHGGPLRILVVGLLCIPPNRMSRLRIDNCGLTVFESFPRSPMLALMNATWHLKGLAAPADPALGN